MQYPRASGQAAILILYGALINNMVIAVFFIAGGIFLTNDWRRYGGILLLLGIALASPLAQFKVLVVTMIVILIGVPGRLMAAALATALTSAYAVGLNFIPQTFALDPNSGIRLAFISDALSSI
ncbi:MAG: hypothetical protein E5W69_04520, partial [Mesorhizobium sp.]